MIPFADIYRGWRVLVTGHTGFVQATANRYRRFYEKGAVESRDQLMKYIDAARSVGAAWVRK